MFSSITGSYSLLRMIRPVAVIANLTHPLIPRLRQGTLVALLCKAPSCLEGEFLYSSSPKLGEVSRSDGGVCFGIQNSKLGRLGKLRRLGKARGCVSNLSSLNFHLLSLISTHTPSPYGYSLYLRGRVFLVFLIFPKFPNFFCLKGKSQKGCKT